MTYGDMLYNYMLTVTNSGGCLPIKNKYGDVKILFKGLDGKIKQTEWESSLENAKNSRKIEYCYDKEDFISEAEEYNWKPLTPFRIPTEPLPVGTKVRVNENAEEECQKAGITLLSEMRDMIGEVYEVVDSDAMSVNFNNKYFPISAVTPVFEEETDEEQAINLLKKHGYKIIKE